MMDGITDDHILILSKSLIYFMTGGSLLVSLFFVVNGLQTRGRGFYGFKKYQDGKRQERRGERADPLPPFRKGECDRTLERLLSLTSFVTVWGRQVSKHLVLNLHRGPRRQGKSLGTVTLPVTRVRSWSHWGGLLRGTSQGRVFSTSQVPHSYRARAVVDVWCSSKITFVQRGGLGVFPFQTLKRNSNASGRLWHSSREQTFKTEETRQNQQTQYFGFKRCLK